MGLKTLLTILVLTFILGCKQNFKKEILNKYPFFAVYRWKGIFFH